MIIPTKIQKSPSASLIPSKKESKVPKPVQKILFLLLWGSARFFIAES